MYNILQFRLNSIFFSGNSIYNLYDEDEDSSMEERSSENAAMRDKVRNLKAKMRVLNASKKVCLFISY